MSKELTEQWRNRTLSENWYYIHLKSDWGNIDCITINYCDEDGVFEAYPDEDIKEVLAPVPDYSEWKQTEEQVQNLQRMVEQECSKRCELESRLKEAEEVIRIYFKNTQDAVFKSLGKNDGYYKRAFIYATAKEYLERWGVK